MSGGGGGGGGGGGLPHGGGMVGHGLGYVGGQHHLGPGNSDDLRFHGTELVMLYDYKVSAILECFWIPGFSFYQIIFIFSFPPSPLVLTF